MCVWNHVRRLKIQHTVRLSSWWCAMSTSLSRSFPSVCSQRSSNWASQSARRSYKYKFIVRICADEWPLTRWSESFLSPTAVLHTFYIYMYSCVWVCVICRFVPDGVLLCHYTLHASVSMCHILIWRVVTTNVSLSAARPASRASFVWFRMDECSLSLFWMGVRRRVGTFPCAFCIMITSIWWESVYRCLHNSVICVWWPNAHHSGWWIL